MVGEKKGFINTIFHEGNIITLYGPPGVGKTNCAVFLIEKAVELGYNVWTTIHFFKYSQVATACRMGRLPTGIKYRKMPLEVHTIKTLSELLLGLLDGEKNIVVLDEAGIFASSTAPMSKKVRELKELAYVIRHLNASLLLIAQAKGSISPDLRTTLVTFELRVRKLSKFYRTLTVKKAMEVIDDEGEHEVTFARIGPVIGKIPLTRFPWDGYFIPKFKFDIKLEDAFNELGEYNSLEILEKGPDIIKRLMKDAKAEESETRTPKQVVREQVREEYMSLLQSGEYERRSDLLAKLANDYGKTYNWAYQICRDLPFEV